MSNGMFKQNLVTNFLSAQKNVKHNDTTTMIGNVGIGTDFNKYTNLIVNGPITIGMTSVSPIDQETLCPYGTIRYNPDIAVQSDYRGRMQYKDNSGTWVRLAVGASMETWLGNEDVDTPYLFPFDGSAVPIVIGSKHSIPNAKLDVHGDINTSSVIKDKYYYVNNVNRGLVNKRLQNGYGNSVFNSSTYSMDSCLNIEVFDLNTINSKLETFEGGVYDGRYIYLCPGTNWAYGLDQQGETTDLSYTNIYDIANTYIVRYDTTLPFTDISSYNYYNLNDKYVNLTNNTEKKLGWNTEDTANLIGKYSDVVLSGYRGAVLDNNSNIYLVPYMNPAANGAIGTIVKYNSSNGILGFDNSGSYDVIDIRNAALSGNITISYGIDTDLSVNKDIYSRNYNCGFTGGIFDGKYIYFIPTITHDGGSATNTEINSSISQISTPYSNNPGGGYSNGNILRFDTTADFTDISADGFSNFNVTANLDASFSGYQSGCFDGKYLYLAPYKYTNNIDNTTKQGEHYYHGNAIRYNTDLSFIDNTSYESIDLKNINENLVGFGGAISDGRYIYYIPNEKGTGYWNGNYDNQSGLELNSYIARYDTKSSYLFSDNRSWEYIDLSSTIDPSCAGYYGGVFDGLNIWYIPTRHQYAKSSNVPVNYQLVKFNSLGSFFDKDSYTTYNLYDICNNCPGFRGGFFDGRYIYLTPWSDNTTEGTELDYTKTSKSGIITRIDTKAPSQLQGIQQLAQYSNFYMDNCGNLGLGTKYPDSTITVDKGVENMDLSCNGTASFNNLHIKGILSAPNFNFDVSFVGNVDICGYLAADKHLQSGTYLDVCTNAYIKQDLEVSGNTWFLGDLSLNNKFSVDSSSHFNEAVDISSILTTDDLYIVNNATISGDISLNNRLFVDGSAHFNEDISADANFSICGDIIMNGNSILDLSSITLGGGVYLTAETVGASWRTIATGSTDITYYDGTVEISENFILVGSQNKIDFCNNNLIFTSELENSKIAIGKDAGKVDQCFNSIAIGENAGKTNQLQYNVAVGYKAGETDQSNNAISIGKTAGKTNQMENCISIGNEAGMTDQCGNAIAIGNLAGRTNQSHNSIAIGNKAGYLDQCCNSIVINATGDFLNTYTNGSLHVAPVRNDETRGLHNAGHMYYYPSTGEITWNNQSDENAGVIERMPNGDASYVMGGVVTTYGFKDAFSWKTNNTEKVKHSLATNMGGYGGSTYMSGITRDLSYIDVETFDMAIADISTNCRGYFGGIFDGRYVYYIPYNRGEGVFSGILTQYDTTQQFDLSYSYKYFDTTTVNSESKGFHSGLYADNYIYLIPYQTDANVYSGLVTRYKTDSSFGLIAGGAYDTYDMSENVSTNSRGFRSGVYDGRYIYYIPYYTGVNYSGVVTRYDTSGAFNNSTSYDTYDLTNVNANCKGFASGIFDGRYVYFVPFNTDVDTFNGMICRFDTSAPFTSSSSYSTFNLANIYSNYVGYSSAVFDGRYIYYIPYQYDNITYNPYLIQYDTQGDGMQYERSYRIFDLMLLNNDCKGYMGGNFDGRYLYLIPYKQTTAVYSGKIVRYDTTKNFTNQTSYSFMDLRENLNDNNVGYVGSVYDGNYLYLVPNFNGVFQSGLVSRINTKSTYPTQNIKNLANIPEFFMDGSCNISISSNLTAEYIDVKYIKADVVNADTIQFDVSLIDYIQAVGNTDMSGTLSVYGDTSMNNLDVSGRITSNGSNTDGFLYIDSSTNVLGDMNICGDFTVYGNIYLAGSSLDFSMDNLQVDNVTCIGNKIGLGHGMYNPEFLIDISGGTSGKGIRMSCNDTHTELFRFSSSNTNQTTYGGSLRYMGANTGDNNAFVITMDDLNSGVPIDAITVLQSAKTGISTSTPQNMLDVAGGCVIGGTYAGDLSAAPYGLLVEGKVGIGMAAHGKGSDWMLDISGGTSGRGIRMSCNDTNTELFRFSSSNTNQTSNGGSLRYLGANTGDNNAFAITMDNQSGTAIDAVVVLQNGNTGIGTSTPGSYKLNVTGNSNVTGYVNTTEGYYVDGTVVISGDINNIIGDFRVLRNKSTVHTDGMYINYDETATNTSHCRFYANSSNSTGIQRGYFSAADGNLYLNHGLYASADVVAYNTSDKRLKTNLKVLEKPLDKINKITGYEFDWIPMKDASDNFVHTNTGRDVGILAQDVAEACDYVTTTRDNGYMGVRYEKLVPLLIESIKELTSKVSNLEEQVKMLKK